MGKDIKKYFADKVIKVDRGGPESRIGKVLDARDDYFAVLTENDGVVYYNTHHIKSFTENMKGQLEFDVEVPKDFKFKKAKNFKELLESLKYVWVKINRGGPDTVEGVLGDVKNDCVYLIANKEIVRITMFHIKNVSYGVKVEKAESQEPESRKKSNNKSKNKKNKTNSSTESEEYESQEYESSSTEVDRQNFEDDLSVLLSSMEKFLRNYSKSN